MFKLYSFNRRHANYLPYDQWNEKGFSVAGPDGPIGVTKEAFRNALKHGRVFFCWYYEHTLCCWGVTEVLAANYPQPLAVPAGVEFRWDGVRLAGVLIWEPNGDEQLPRTFVKRLELAQATLQDITDDMNGEVINSDELEPLISDD